MHLLRKPAFLFSEVAHIERWDVLGRPAKVEFSRSESSPGQRNGRGRSRVQAHGREYARALFSRDLIFHKQRRSVSDPSHLLWWNGLPKFCRLTTKVRFHRGSSGMPPDSPFKIQGEHPFSSPGLPAMQVFVLLCCELLVSRPMEASFSSATLRSISTGTA